jgi:hypothetical protein
MGNLQKVAVFSTSLLMQGLDAPSYSVLRSCVILSEDFVEEKFLALPRLTQGYPGFIQDFSLVKCSRLTANY